ncbi:hypothetical protein ACFW81_27880 [Streptomyces angustmyceticus]
MATVARTRPIASVSGSAPFEVFLPDGHTLRARSSAPSHFFTASACFP